MNGNEHEQNVDRLATTLSVAIGQRIGAIEERIRTVAQAIERAADKFSRDAAFPKLGGSQSAEGERAPQQPSGGIQLVRVLNGADVPVPVTIMGVRPDVFAGVTAAPGTTGAAMLSAGSPGGSAGQTRSSPLTIPSGVVGPLAGHSGGASGALLSAGPAPGPRSSLSSSIDVGPSVLIGAAVPAVSVVSTLAQTVPVGRSSEPAIVPVAIMAVHPEAFATINMAPAFLSTTLVPAARAASNAPESGLTGVVSAQIINPANSPVPVTIIGQQQGGGGLAGILGAAGSFLGGIVGGFVGGLAAPVLTVVALGELIAAIATAIPLAREIRSLVLSIDQLMHGLFNELRAAGILPAQRLVATALVLLDSVLQMVLVSLSSVLNWGVQVLGKLSEWMGSFLVAASRFATDLFTSLGNYLGQTLTRLVPFLAGTLDYLLESAFRSLVSILRTIVAGIVAPFLIAASVLRESIVYAGEYLAFTLRRVINELVDILNIALAPLHTSIPKLAGVVAPAPLAGRIEGAIPEGRRMARRFAEFLLPEQTLGPPPKFQAPTFKTPTFEMPKLELPEYQPTGSLLDRIFGREKVPAAEPPLRAQPLVIPTTPGAPARAEGQSVTFNGDINVQINTQTVDQSNADSVGRTVAIQIFDELRRLVEIDRFRRGLPTESVA